MRVSEQPGKSNAPAEAGEKDAERIGNGRGAGLRAARRHVERRRYVYRPHHPSCARGVPRKPLRGHKYRAAGATRLKPVGENHKPYTATRAMTANDLMPHTAYRESGVDTDEADAGLDRLVKQIKRTWPPRGKFGAVQLDIGYFANVIDIGGGMGLGICTDGVGSKAIIAQMMDQYDTIGIDC